MQVKKKEDAGTARLRLPPPILPLGYSTLEDWWRQNEPAAFELLVDPAGTLAADGRRLVARCEAEGIGYRQGPRPSFPLWLIERFYPVNP